MAKVETEKCISNVNFKGVWISISNGKKNNRRQRGRPRRLGRHVRGSGRAHGRTNGCDPFRRTTWSRTVIFSHSIALVCIALVCIALDCIALPFVNSSSPYSSSLEEDGRTDGILFLPHCVAFDSFIFFPSHLIGLHCIALHCIALPFVNSSSSTSSSSPEENGREFGVEVGCVGKRH